MIRKFHKLHFLIYISSVLLISGSYIYFYIVPSMKTMRQYDLEIRELKGKSDHIREDIRGFVEPDDAEARLMDSNAGDFRKSVPESKEALAIALKDKFGNWDDARELTLIDRGQIVTGTGEPAAGHFILAEKKTAMIYRDSYANGLTLMRNFMAEGVKIFPQSVEIVSSEGKAVFVIKGTTYHLQNGELPGVLKKMKKNMIDSSSEHLKHRVTQEMIITPEIVEVNGRYLK